MTQRKRMRAGCTVGLARADDLLDKATSLSPERFARTIAELVRTIERDHGVDRDEQRRRQTFLSRRLNPATGMTEGRFALHPELANRVFGAIDRHVAATIAAGARVAQRLVCDGNITSVVVDSHGTAVAVGRTTCHPTPKQRRALAQQYRNCAIENCDIAYHRTEIHHIIP